MEPLRVVVTGLVAQYPLGGVTWDYLQYVLGLRDLGHDVYYLEDTGQWPYDPETGGLAETPDYSVAFLTNVTREFGLEERWAYRFPWESQWFGLSDARRREVVETADLLINVSGTLARPEEYRSIRRLAYVDSDPVFTQAKLARGQSDFAALVDAHDVLFSFGETLPGQAPDDGRTWRPTRQPIVLSCWRPATPHREAFTTVMNWTSHNSVTHAGVTYGQKNEEFERFVDLPERVAPTVLEVAMAEGKTQRAPRERLAHRGWRIVDPDVVCPGPEEYRGYIERSKAEWSVAKNGYVRGRAGWFSCRSACYLAAGRPVVVQETGFSDVLPTGEGLLTFDEPDEAVVAIQRVEADWSRHSAAARKIAESCFSADRVLSRLLEEATA